jgi:hypothetical protein
MRNTVLFGIPIRRRVLRSIPPPLMFMTRSFTMIRHSSIPGPSMSIIQQAMSIFDGSRYVASETDRIVSVLAEPVSRERTASLAEEIGRGDIQPKDLAGRIVLSLPFIDRDMAKGDHPGYVRRAGKMAQAVLRTVRDVESGHLPDDPKTLMNRTLLDMSYQEDASWQLEVRDLGAQQPVRSRAHDLVFGSKGLDDMKRMASDDLKRIADGDLTSLSLDAKRSFGKDAGNLAVSGSWSDKLARMPKKDRAVDAAVLLTMSKGTSAGR